MENISRSDGLHEQQARGSNDDPHNRAGPHAPPPMDDTPGALGSAIAVFSVDMDGRVTGWNDGAVRLTGFAADEIVGNPLSLVCPHFAGDVLRAEVITPLVSAGHIETEVLFRKKSGETLSGRLSASLQRDRSGQPMGMIGYVADVDEQMRAEEQMRRRHAELAHISRLNTAGEMASGLAHELNQPLSAIVNYTQGCARRLRAGTEDRDELLRAVEQAASEARRAAEIIRRLRNFLRKRESRWSSLDVNDAVRGVIGLVGPELRAHDVRLQLELVESLPLVLADSVQIEQVILNLARNSIEAMSGNHSHVRELTIETATTGDAVRLSVRDSGPGITVETADKIFDPFFTTKPEGMGIGLSLCRTIVVAAGGRLWFERDGQQGALFHFELPLLRDE